MLALNVDADVDQITLHFIVSFANEDYNHMVSLRRFKEHVLAAPGIPPYQVPIPEEYRIAKNYTAPARKARAAIVMLGASALLLFTPADRRTSAQLGRRRRREQYEAGGGQMQQALPLPLRVSQRGAL